MADRPPLSAFRNDISGKQDDFPILNRSSLPEEMPQEEIQEEPGYFSRVGSAYQESAEDIQRAVQEGAQAREEGRPQGLLRTGLRTVGAVAKSVFAPVIEAPGIKQALEFTGKQIAKIPGFEGFTQKASELSQKYPEATKDIEDLINIVTVGAGRAVEKPLQTAFERTGASMARKAEIAAQKARMDFAKTLVMPMPTKAIREAQVPRTIEQGGVFKKDIVTPTTTEAGAIAAITRVPGISPKNTFQKNYNIVQDYNRGLAKQLEALIKANDFSIPKKEILSRLNVAAKELEGSPLIVGDAQKTAQKMLAKAKQLVEANEGTGSGLLKARKEFDEWIREQKPKIFDAASENALTTANREIRNTFNALLEEKAPQLGIKASLKEQSSLHRAMENIQPKAAFEANTVFGRSLQRIGDALGTRNKLVQTLAAATGIGVFGASVTYALPLTLGTAAGWLLYKGGRLVMKPEIRKTVGELLEKYGEQIAPVDRAILVGLLEEFQESSEEVASPIIAPTVNAISNQSQNIRSKLESFLQ